MSDAFESYQRRMAPLLTQLAPPRIPLQEVYENLARRYQFANDLSRGISADLQDSFALRETLAAQRTVLDIVKFQETLTSHRAVLDIVNQQAAMWERIGADARQFAAPHLHEAFLTWDYGLAGITAQLQTSGLLAAREQLSARLLEPTRVYTAFVDMTTRQLEHTSSVRRAIALRASLVLAEAQLRDITDAFAGIVTLPVDDALVSEPRPLLSLRIQQGELLAVEVIEDEDDSVTLLRLSPTAQLADKARTVLGLIIQCNEAAKVANKPEIFTPTTRLLEASIDLPWLVARDKRSLGEVVDALYFTLYEGAGKDHLRFLKAEGGVVEPTECEAIWAIKDLRNRWLRHDADHGDERSIRRAWATLSARFTWFGLERSPRSRVEFHLIQQRLLEEAELFLRRVLNGLRIGP